MKNLKRIIGFVVFVSATSHAAPIPGTSSSELVAPQLGLYRSANGFQISAGETDWLPTPAPATSKYIETLYRAPERVLGTRATLTVRIDELNKDMPLKDYMQTWAKEYPRYGFDVMGAKPFQLDEKKGYVVDLINREKERQVRQVVFIKDQNAVILTCRDHVKNFKKSLRSCNEIIKSFSWTQVAKSESAPATPSTN